MYYTSKRTPPMLRWSNLDRRNFSRARTTSTCCSTVAQASSSVCGWDCGGTGRVSQPNYLETRKGPSSLALQVVLIAAHSNIGWYSTVWTLSSLSC